MPCEHYKDALIETVAGGAAPQEELFKHLAVCAPCREAFAQEQSLFSAIDSSLHAAANAEVPPSLLPRVRVGLDEVSAPQRRWVQPLIFASASAVLVLAIFLMARPHHGAAESVAKQGPVVAPAPVESATNANPEAPSKDIPTAFAAERHPDAAQNSTNFNAAASSTPEVLVPPNEREALARFVATLNERSRIGAALLVHVPEKEGGLVSGDPLQIPDIEIKPLEGTEAEPSDGASNRR